MIRNSLISIILFFCSAKIWSQDSLRISHQQFLAIVKNYHPMAFSYQLQTRIAEREISRALGNFDPILQGKSGEKKIDELLYYKQRNVELGIPTWYGIDITAAYTYMDGQKLNNSDTKGGLYQVGLTVPLGRNLLYDKRRAILDQAKAALKMTEAEQQLLTNDLLLEADNTYWEWVKNYEIYLLQKEAVKINLLRLQLTKKTYEYGERPAIDTIEASSQLQGFILQKQEAWLNFARSTQDLQLYLWQENREILPLQQPLYPSSRLNEHSGYLDYQFLAQTIENNSVEQHAAIKYYQRKGDILQSEKRLKWQSFLPKLDFTYNLFNKETYRADLLPLFTNNYQYGLSLEIPVFLRQAKADYEIANIKIKQNDLDWQMKAKEIYIKFNIYKSEAENYYKQIETSTQNISNYQRLLRAEEIKFSNGESSLFVINSRETKLLEAQEKNLELRNKFLKSYNKLRWLNENFSK